MLVRTHNCGELRDSNIGEKVVVCGWINSYRDHGTGLIFVDLRDRYGLTQVVFDREDASAEMLERADKLRPEDVIAVRGTVRIRVGGENPKLRTGKVEVVVEELDFLADAETPPFLPSDEANLPNEELRLRHRYLDLRRPRMQEILQTRYEVTRVARDFFHENGFLEVETPILYKSTPEGAREYIVPSRVQPGNWYALPQSPQLFKQILMVSGCDRYLQICRCFRDEDPRADRQAEFTQIDLEMSFVGREQVMGVMEGFVTRLFSKMRGVNLPAFERMTYKDAMDRYGSDRPDRRYGLELVDVSDLAKKTDFKVFSGALAKKHGVVKAIRVTKAEGAERLTRKLTDGYTEFVKQFGAGGVPVAKYNGTAFETGVAKFIEPITRDLVERLQLSAGDVVLFGADTYKIVSKALGELRQQVASDLGLVDEKKWDVFWVIDFPMFEHDEGEGRYFAKHHPFTAPNPDQLDTFMRADFKDTDAIEGIVSAGYDVVCNGSEIGGGSIRIHRSDVQSRVFDLLGISREDAEQKFSFLLEALRFGAPPHGGIAFGLDRLVMLLCGTDNIRDVIAFPKTQNGADLMTRAPSPVTEAQMRELYLKSVAPQRA